MIKKLHFKTLLLLCAMIMGIGSAWADTVTTIATATFDGKNGNYTEGWTTTGTGLNRNDCIIIGANENITSPAFDLSGYDEITISIKARRFGTLAGSKATIDVAIDGTSVGTTEATGTNASTSLTDITFTPTADMTNAVLVFTCTNATNAGSSHGAGINTITITGTTSSTSNATLTGITLSGDYETTFPQNGTFSYEGLIVTASYDDGTSNAVTNYDVSEPDMTTLGTQTVTVSYTEKEVTKTATYDITIEEVQDYATLPFSWAGGSSADLKKENGVSVYCDGSDYSSTNTPYLVKFSKNGHYVMVKTDSQPGKVTVGVKMLGGSDATSITVQGSADGETFTDVETLTISGAKNDILNLETSNVFATTDRYVRLYFNKGSGSNVGVGPITIAVPSTDPAIVARNVELEADATSGEIAYSIVNPVAGTSLTAASEAEWISDFVVAADKVTFTTTANTGEERTATVTLTYGTLTKDVTVTQAAYVDPNAPGTENNPYTVADAIAYINTLSGTSADEVYVSGIISQVDSYNSTYSSITYWISDDGTTTEQMEVYSGKGLEGAAFSSKDDLQVGDIVTVKGYVKMYNTTPEFDKNNQLVSFERPVVTTPSISVSPNTIEAPATGAEGTITVTYNNFTNVIASVYFCDANEDQASYDWIETSIDNDNNVGYVIAANEGEARTAYMMVCALDDDYNSVFSELITITQAKYVETTTYTLATEIVSGKHYIIVGQKDGTYKAAGTQKSNNRAAVEVSLNEDVISVASSDVKEFVIYGPNAQGNYTIYDEDLGYLYAAQGTGTGNYLRTESKLDADGNGIWTISIDAEGVASVVATNPNITRNTIRYNSGSSCFSCYSSGQQNIYLYERDGEATPTETVTVTDAKYATYFSENALDFSNTGLTAYIAKMNGSIVSFEPVTKVPAYSGVLLKADAAGDVPVGVATTVDDVTDNAFKGVIEATLVSEPGIFVLLNGDEGVGFYKTLNAFTVGAHTAYLPPLAGVSRSFIGLNETTGISDMNRETITNNRYFDLQGRRVLAPTKGLYIVNGKKVVVK